MPFVFLRPFWRRPRVDITFGEPFVLEKPARINGESVHAATDQIMRRVAALLPESYRGYYGSAPAEGASVETPSGAGDQ
jgi:1-acyl-sn-glycerol-3-phosphate acyltransferase